MPSNETTVGQHIRNNVIPPGMSVKAAAARLGVGRPALSNLLNGKAALSPKMALRLERAFGASRTELLALQASHDDERHRQEGGAVAVGRYVPTFLTIKAHDIAAWAEQVAAREHLPVLLRKLIHGTGRDLECVDFPGFDNSQRPGWDGWVEAGTATPWIPKGVSGWEFGTSARPRQKADHDYAKRLRLPAEERARCTFIFVTPRNWPGKAEWARQKGASGDGWRAVRAYDASDLEQWLEQSVAAPVWLAGHLPMPVEGVETLEACWSKWASAATPNITPHIFKTAVAACIKPFKGWLEASPQRPFLVAADSTGEALAFIACLFEHADVSRQRDLAAVFTSSNALNTLAAASSPFIPVAANAETQESLPHVFTRMHCVATCPRNAVDPAPDFALPLMGYTAFTQALEAMGVGRHESQRLISESGRSPTILRRRLSVLPAIRRPSWASDQTLARSLIPICLAGAWHTHKSADQSALKKLAGCEYEELERNITALQQVEEDCPVWSVGQHHGVTSKVDALFAIAGLMTEQDIGKFFRMAEEVLSEADPALELPESDRWMAAVHNKLRDHSAALRDGIGETLVLLSMHGNSLFQDRLGMDIAAQVSSLVARLLAPLNQKLQSQERDLAIYAEAAPGRFLEILEEDLGSDEPVVHQLLRPVRGAFSHCPRTGLLWALECVAWNPDFLSRACIVLAQLFRFEIDDNWANHPANSLAGILRSWMPQTAASLADRKAVLAMLVKRFPLVAWQLCVAEIRIGQHFAMDNYRPRWRSDASDVGDGVTEHERREFIQAAKGVLLSWQDPNQSTFGDLVERMESLTQEEQSSVWAQIEQWARSNAGEKAKAELRERVRLFASGARASLVFEELQPEDLVVRHGWLFANAWIRESSDTLASGDDFEAHLSRIDGLRQSAIEEVWATHGLTGIMAMVEDGGDGHTVGRFAASCAGGRPVDVLRGCLFREAAVAQFDRFMYTFITACANPADSDLLLDASQQLDLEQCVRLWRCAPFQNETWRMLDRLPNEEVRAAYWRTVSPPFSRRFTESECTEVVEKLLAAGRPRAAFTLLARQWANIETASLKRLLMSLVSAGDEEDACPIAPSDVSDALSVLGERSSVSSGEMARLEFAFIAALDEHGMPNLERQIAESPASFVEILSYAFKRLDGGQDPQEWQIDESSRKAVASAAYRFLQQVTRIPGTEAGGSVNVDALLRWLTATRRLCAKVDRAVIGDLKIGELLSKAPPDDDGTWPCDAVCQALDAVASEDVVRGFVIGKRNARGVFWRRGDGGDDERELAAQYRGWAQRRRFDYPFASRAVDQIAQWYDDDAKREDAEAKLAKRLNTRG